MMSRGAAGRRGGTLPAVGAFAQMAGKSYRGWVGRIKVKAARIGQAMAVRQLAPQRNRIVGADRAVRRRIGPHRPGDGQPARAVLGLDHLRQDRTGPVERGVQRPQGAIAADPGQR